MSEYKRLTSICASCGNCFSFSKKSVGRKRKYCSFSCRKKAYRKSANERKKRISPLLKTFVCKTCGKEFAATRKRKYCSVSCRACVTEKPFTEVGWSHCNPHPPCLWCGKQTTRHDQKGFCSQSCSCKYRSYQSEYRNARDKYLCERGLFDFVDKDAVERYKELFLSKVVRLISTIRHVMNVKRHDEIHDCTCAVCGKKFSFSFGTRPRYCSFECRKKSEPFLRMKRLHRSSRRRLYKKLSSEGHFERVDPFEIFERDGWRCSRCGVKTPIENRGTFKNNAPELDHITPLSKGGWHVRENLQCLCRKCNQEKSDRIEGLQPNLFSCFVPQRG